MPPVPTEEHAVRIRELGASHDESLDAALERLRESYRLRSPARLRSAVEAAAGG